MAQAAVDSAQCEDISYSSHSLVMFKLNAVSGQLVEKSLPDGDGLDIVNLERVLRAHAPLQDVEKRWVEGLRGGLGIY